VAKAARRRMFLRFFMFDVSNKSDTVVFMVTAFADPVAQRRMA
jgi:hypothetical protein